MCTLIHTLRSKLYLLTTAWSIKCCWLPYFVAYWNNTLESELFKQSFLFTSLAFETHTATGGMVQISASLFSFQCLSVCVPISWTQQNPGRNRPRKFWYTTHRNISFSFSWNIKPLNRKDFIAHANWCGMGDKVVLATFSLHVLYPARARSLLLSHESQEKTPLLMCVNYT